MHRDPVPALRPFFRQKLRTKEEPEHMPNVIKLSGFLQNIAKIAAYFAQIIENTIENI